MTKPIFLRAFKFENKSISEKETDVKNNLINKLKNTKVYQRRMLLNTFDKEEDIICDFDLNDNYVFSAVLRVKPSSEVPNIPDSLFNDEKFLISELDRINTESTTIYKDHFYFLLNNEYLITNLNRTTTITRLQTYLNWFLEDLRGEKLYELTPLIEHTPDYSLSELKKIKVQDPEINENGKSNYVEEKKQRKISLDLLMDLISDVKGIEEYKLEQIVSAELLLKFRKPKQMSKEEYQKIMGAYMKPISDAENITFYPKKGSPVKGNEILKIKNIEIETTESGKIVENQLKQEMEKFLREL